VKSLLVTIIAAICNTPRRVTSFCSSRIVSDSLKIPFGYKSFDLQLHGRGLCDLVSAKRRPSCGKQGDARAVWKLELIV